MDMREHDIVARLSASVDARHLIESLRRPTFSTDIDLWDIAWIAAYFKRSDDIARKLVKTAGFPRPVMLPSFGSGRSHALYKACEVIAWAESLKS